MGPPRPSTEYEAFILLVFVSKYALNTTNPTMFVMCLSALPISVLLVVEEVVAVLHVQP